MYFNPYKVRMMAKERVKDLLREAEQVRLRRVANSARPRLVGRVVASIGGLLLSAGKKPQERHAPVKTDLTVSRSSHKPTMKPS
jgi:hypothetical protein